MKMRKFLSLILAIVTITGCLVNTSSAIVTRDDYTQSQLDSSSYDLRKYTDAYWEGNIVYNEIVFPIKGANGEIMPFELMYNATEIVSVKDYTLRTTYTEGVDYKLENGNLVIIPTGNIKLIDYNYMHPLNAPAGYGANEIYPYYPHKDGSRYEYWPEDSEISLKSIAVTYIHNDTWDGEIPESQETELPKTFEKLANDEPLTIVTIGDSVTAGAHASGSLGILPAAPAYPQMTLNALRQKYSNNKINLINSAVGGTISTFSESKVNSSVINYSPDLVIINYGMNDSSADRVGIPGAQFRTNIANHIEYIRKKLPNCEILLVSSLYGNRYTVPAERYEEHAGILHELAAKYDGVGVADPQAVQKYLMDEVGKDYLCFMADNMVHPGDFGMRLMTQTILEALSFEETSTYSDILMEKLEDYVWKKNADPAKEIELTEALAAVEETLATLTDEWDVSSVIDSAYVEIDKILNRCDYHVYDDTVVEPTCKEGGYTVSVCKVCGYSYTHSATSALNREHIMDSGVQTVYPTYKTAGEITYSCALCDYTETEVVPMLTKAPYITGEGFMHISNSHNYMAELNMNPYSSGSGSVEFDFCPVTIEKYDGVPYVGVWFNNYTICACYNFQEQQVQIINTSLPFGGGLVFASADYEWTSDGGEFDNNWKKFCAKISGTSVSIYIDGELILSDTNSRYSTSGEVPLVYSNGECYFDNFKVVKGNYNPATGTGGTVLGYWDLNSSSAVSRCVSDWGQSLASARFISATKANISTGHYAHTVHSGTIDGYVESGCAHGGYTQYSCALCGEIYFDNYTEALCDSHTLTEKTVVIAPTTTTEGLYTYKCENCDLTFTEIAPRETNSNAVIVGDIDGNGTVSATDLSAFARFLTGAEMKINNAAADINGDGIISAPDYTTLELKLRSA